MLPEMDVARVHRWVDDRNAHLPDGAQGLVRYELDVADRHLTILECRPPWRPEAGSEWTRFPIVRFQYTKVRHEWVTFWRDGNLAFHRYELFRPSQQIDVLLTQVDEDRSGIFWG
jgi:hypothetical protein